MKRYNHDFLFAGQSATVQKTYRLPRYLEDQISAVASSNKLTRTDVVIEALLHYFSPHILERMAADIEQSALNLEACHEDGNAKRRHTFEKRRLEMLRAEFHDYFHDSIEKLLARLKDASALEPSEEAPVQAACSCGRD